MLIVPSRRHENEILMVVNGGTMRMKGEQRLKLL
jgi:hypothetical protein